MFERCITTADVNAALLTGKVIEDYPTDKPYPSYLWLGHANSKTLHIVYADNHEENERIIITVYEPDPNLWSADLASRKKQ